MPINIARVTANRGERWWASGRRSPVAVYRKNPEVTPRKIASACCDSEERTTIRPPTTGAAASANRNAKSFFLGRSPRVTSNIVFRPSLISCAMIPIATINPVRHETRVAAAIDAPSSVLWPIRPNALRRPTCRRNSSSESHVGSRETRRNAQQRERRRSQ